MIFMFNIVTKQKQLSCNPEWAIRIHAMLYNVETPGFLSVLLVLLVVEKGYVLLLWNRRIHQWQDTWKKVAVT